MVFEVRFTEGEGAVCEIGGSVWFGCNEEMTEPLSIFDSAVAEIIPPPVVVFLFELLVTPGPGLGCTLGSLGGVTGAVGLIWSGAGAGAGSESGAADPQVMSSRQRIFHTFNSIFCHPGLRN